MTTTQEFFQTHAQDGVLTPQQAAQFLELAQGDTGIKPPEPDDVPAVIADADKTPTAVQGDPDPANTVILAKDGKHTIGYEKLVEAREGEKHWKAQAEAQAAELEALKAAALARADAGAAPTRTDNAVAAATAAIDAGVNPDLFGDFSEEALAKGIQTLMSKQVAQLSAELRGELAQLVQPLQQKQAVDATQTHYEAIYAKHPDADSLAESKELKDWIGKQPSFVRTGYESVLEKGTTAEIVEFFDAFKAATGKAQGNAQADPKAIARAALAKLQDAVPSSLSDIPGGTAGPANKHEAMSKLSPIEQAEALAGMSQDARDAFLNRRM